MIYGLYHSVAGMLVNEHRQDVIANNIANAETVGFKRDMAVFAERLPASAAGVRDAASQALLDGLSGGLWLGQTETDYSEGAFVKTDQPEDVALAGPGFLKVRSNDRELLTRDGRMRLDENGRLVAASDGAAVLSAGGGEIRVNPRRGPISIDADGWVAQNGTRVARLAVVEPEDYLALRKLGAARFDAGATRLRLAEADVLAGHVESSGVQPVQEMVAMIEAGHAYQFNAQMVTLQDQTAGRLISTLT